MGRGAVPGTVRGARDTAVTPVPSPRIMHKYDDTSERYSYVSTLVRTLKQRDGRLSKGRVTVLTPRQSGFCWGVDRALAIIDDAVRENPGRTIWLLNQIIHNPRVNRDLLARGVRFLRGPHATGPGTFDEISRDDLVVIPAFSAEVEDLEEIASRGLEAVDTTCPWVIKPHKRTLRYVEDGFTTVIHGTVGHDETRATCSLIEHEGGHFVVVHDLEETDRLCAHLRGEREPAMFLEEFGRAVSRAFDPTKHLERVGLVNQTTMLASESRTVAERIRTAVLARRGEDALATHFRDFDTICRATQDNQDAFLAVMGPPQPDVLVVVGGFDSSNTKNLARIGDDHRIPAFHIEDPDDIKPATIRHRDRRSGEIHTTNDWLKTGDVTVAMTAGASTPDTQFGHAIRKVFEAAGETIDETALAQV